MKGKKLIELTGRTRWKRKLNLRSVQAANEWDHLAFEFLGSFLMR
jgi:hypothetical protein